MTTADIERRLTDLLRDRAEGAMSRTDTRERLSQLLDEGERGERARRSVWAAGVAAAVVVIALVVFVSGSGDDRADAPPAGPGLTPAESAAARFTEAFYRGDVGTARGMLAEDAAFDEMPNIDVWSSEVAWQGASGSSLDSVTCEEQSTDAAGIRVACAFLLNSLGSETRGLGPYPGVYEVVLRDGRVVTASEDFPFATNGYGREVWGPFADFVSGRSLRDARVMYVDLTYTAARRDAAALKLWQRYLAEYVRTAP